MDIDVSTSDIGELCEDIDEGVSHWDSSDESMKW
jgi:hypothetical protein